VVDDDARGFLWFVVRAGVRRFVSLIPLDEQADLEDYVTLLPKSPAVTFVRFPIPDKRAAPDPVTLLELVHELADPCRSATLGPDGAVYLHCLGGHGRTGLVSTSVVRVLTGWPIERCLDRFRALHNLRRSLGRANTRRPVTTAQQKRLVALFENTGSDGTRIRKERRQKRKAPDAREDELVVGEATASPRRTPRRKKAARSDADVLAARGADEGEEVVAAAEKKEEDGGDRKCFRNGELVLFYGRDTPFSNFYVTPLVRCQFVWDGVSYCCGEQALMAAKARLFGDLGVLARIMATASPSRHRSLGRQVTPYVEETWPAEAPAIMARIALAKFAAGSPLSRALLETGDRLIAEASPSDRLFGIGWRADQPGARDPRRWRGSNWLGNALMAARRVLVAATAQTASE